MKRQKGNVIIEIIIGLVFAVVLLIALADFSCKRVYDFLIQNQGICEAQLIRMQKGELDWPSDKPKEINMRDIANQEEPTPIPDNVGEKVTYTRLNINGVYMLCDAEGYCFEEPKYKG